MAPTVSAAATQITTDVELVVKCNNIEGITHNQLPDTGGSNGGGELSSGTCTVQGVGALLLIGTACETGTGCPPGFTGPGCLLCVPIIVHVCVWVCVGC